MPLRKLIAGLAAAVALAACGNNAGTDSSKIDIVAGFYPLQFVAERVGGDAVNVVNLAPPGAEPHDMELKPSQIKQLADAKLVIYLKSFMPELDKAIEQNAVGKSFDVTTVSPMVKGEPDEHEDENALDPHIWLDPTRMITIAEAFAAQLGKTDPAHAADYKARAATLKQDLTTLDTQFSEGLQTCQRREIVTSHAAFGYMASRYKLEQIALTGLSPEDEPTPQRLKKVAEEAKEHGATTIFFETLVSDKVAKALAKEVGAKTAVLDPLESLPESGVGDYFSVMRSNLETLRAALGCS